MAWHGMAWHGVVWCGVVWCGVVAEGENNMHGYFGNNLDQSGYSCE
jgi:hypothetical protein